MSKASEVTVKMSREFTREEMKICDDVSQFIMFIGFIICAIVVTLILREGVTFPVDQEKTVEVVTLGTAKFWMMLYLFIGAIMLHSWGYKPLRRFLQSQDFAGQHADVFKKLTRAVMPLAAALAIIFIGFSTLMEVTESLLPKTLVQISNVTIMVMIFMAWRVLDYARYVSVRKALGQAVIKEAPWKGLLDLVSAK